MWSDVVTLVQMAIWVMWPSERDSFRGRHTTSFCEGERGRERGRKRYGERGRGRERGAEG